MASPFWRYFHEKLNWPAIFRPGPVSALVKGLALYMDDAREDILWLRKQWLPATADDAMIAAYGASRGILRQPFDTDEGYRRRVINAFAWHKLGGKVRGLERIFAENHLTASILPASNPDWWAHFRVRLDVTGMVFDVDTAALAFWLANEYKPARSRLDRLETDASVPLPEAVGVGLVGRTTARPLLHFPPPPPSPLCRRVLLCAAHATSVRPRLWSPPKPAPALFAGPRMAARAVTRFRLAVPA